MIHFKPCGTASQFRRNFLANCDDIFLHTFPPDGYDPLTKTYIGVQHAPNFYQVLRKAFRPTNKPLISRRSDIEQHLYATPMFLSSFLGLPNRPYYGYDGKLLPATPGRLLRRFFNIRGFRSMEEREPGYESTIPWWRDWQWGDLLRIPVFGLWNTAMLGINLFLHAAKILTEVLPMITAMFFENGVKPYLADKQKASGFFPLSFGIWLVNLLVGILSLAPALIQFAGQSITSPNILTRHQWYMGKFLGKALAGYFGASPDSLMRTILSRSFGVLFAGLAMTSTVAAYCFLFPLGIKFVGLHLLNALHYLGPAFYTLGKAGITLASNFSLLSFIPGMVSTIVTIPKAVGIGLLAGSIITLGGSILDKLTRFFENRFFKPDHKPAQNSHSQISIQPGRLQNPQNYPGLIPKPNPENAMDKNPENQALTASASPLPVPAS